MTTTTTLTTTSPGELLQLRELVRDGVELMLTSELELDTTIGDECAAWVRRAVALARIDLRSLLDD